MRLRSVEEIAMLFPWNASSLPEFLNFFVLHKQKQSLPLLMITNWWLILARSISKHRQLLGFSLHSVCCTLTANLCIIQAPYSYLFFPTLSKKITSG